jgi:hypothetical protein
MPGTSPNQIAAPKRHLALGLKIRTPIIQLSMGLLNFFRLGSTAATTNKLAELASLPFNLNVVHTPDRVGAERGGRSGCPFIGVTTDGRRVKGEAIVETLPEVLKRQTMHRREPVIGVR